MGPMVWKVLGTAAAVIAGTVTRNVLDKAWVSGTGRMPPKNPTSPSTSMMEAVAWTALSGALIGIARMLATRRAAQYYQRSAGHLPKNLEGVG